MSGPVGPSLIWRLQMPNNYEEMAPTQVKTSDDATSESTCICHVRIRRWRQVISFISFHVVSPDPVNEDDEAETTQLKTGTETRSERQTGTGTKQRQSQDENCECIYIETADQIKYTWIELNWISCTVWSSDEFVILGVFSHISVLKIAEFDEVSSQINTRKFFSSVFIWSCFFEWLLTHNSTVIASPKHIIVLKFNIMFNSRIHQQQPLLWPVDVLLLFTWALYINWSSLRAQRCSWCLSV